MRQTGEATARLGRSVGDSSAAIEQMVSSITLVAGNIGGIADTVNTVSSAIAELAVSINAVAGNAQEANTLSLQADTKARDGGKAVERLVESTREIATDINGVVVKMEELGTASERIGDIVEVIDTIADQTNLLALNAAIEAARAGEHGRGFAVVADEVRKLAENSARSTREIGQLVKDIQAKIVEVIHSFTISGGKAESGLEMADLAGRAITDILGAVAQASRLIEQISVAAREQAAGSSAIVNSVEQMNNLMREAARSLDEQNTSNQQMITTITAMQQLTDAVTNGVALQRSACDRIDAAAKLLVSTSDASKTASVGIDDLAKSLRERVNVIVSDVHPKSTPELAHACFVRLATGRN
jgi:methyl-accepting chemotaxis protein